MSTRTVRLPCFGCGCTAFCLLETGPVEIEHTRNHEAFCLRVACVEIVGSWLKMEKIRWQSHWGLKFGKKIETRWHQSTRKI